jgi:hypothetical protein
MRHSAAVAQLCERLRMDFFSNETFDAVDRRRRIGGQPISSGIKDGSSRSGIAKGRSGAGFAKTNCNFIYLQGRTLPPRLIFRQ